MGKKKSKWLDTCSGKSYVLLEAGGVYTRADCTIAIDRGLMIYFSVSGEEPFAQKLRETREYCMSVMDGNDHLVVTAGHPIQVPCGQSLDTYGGGTIHFVQPCVLDTAY